MALNRTSDQFLLDAYSGQGGFITGDYLIEHPRETANKLQRRKDLAVYPNFVRKIVDVYLGFLWRQLPMRESDPLYDAFIMNADGCGTDLNRLLAGFQRLALVLGTVYVLVDKSVTAAQSKASETLPYCVLRMPDQLVNEQKDALGCWLSVTFRERLNGQIVYRTLTRDGWQISKDANGNQVIESGQYPLGQVPVVALHTAKPLDPLSSRAFSWAFDVAQLNWDLFNIRSELRELFRSQTFAILALPVADDREREALKDMTISTENAITYNPNGGGTPQFIAPPADPVKLYMEQIAATIEDIYRVANLEFVGGIQQSGVALAFHFQEANSSLRTMAEQCEQAENQIAQLVSAWQGETFKGHIAYPSEFNLSDLKEELATALDAVNLGLGAEFDKALKKRLAQKILANDVSAETLAAINTEIDAQGDTYKNRLAQQVNGGL